MAKKQKKKQSKKQIKANNCCGHGLGLLLILIIVLVWVSQATWSKVLITIAAALIILGKVAMHSSICCKKK